MQLNFYTIPKYPKHFHKIFHDKENREAFEKYLSNPSELTIKGQKNPLDNDTIEKLKESFEGTLYVHLDKDSQPKPIEEIKGSLMLGRKRMEFINDEDFWSFEHDENGNLMAAHNGDYRGAYIETEDSFKRRFGKSAFESMDDLITSATTYSVSREKEYAEAFENDLDELVEKVNAPETQETLKKMLEFQSQFHGYSFRNQWLILSQAKEREEATGEPVSVERLAAFNKWKSIKNDKGEGVKVNKGEKGFNIFVPVTTKTPAKWFDTLEDVQNYCKDRGISDRLQKVQKVGGDTELLLREKDGFKLVASMSANGQLTVMKAKLDETIDKVNANSIDFFKEQKGDKYALKYAQSRYPKTKSLDNIAFDSADRKIYKHGISFKISSVFDVNQTNAKEIGAYKTLEYRATDNQIDERVYEDLKAMIMKAHPDLKIKEQPISGGAKGIYSPESNEIVIDSGVEDVTSKFQTLLHEYGHSQLHSKLDYDEIHNSRPELELQAEAFAYSMCKRFGITSASELYIASWSDKQTLKENFSLIQKTVHNAMETLQIEKYLQDLANENAPAVEAVGEETVERTAEEKSVEKPLPSRLDTQYQLAGDTFAVKIAYELKDEFKEAFPGAKWSKAEKAWLIPHSEENDKKLAHWIYDGDNSQTSSAKEPMYTNDFIENLSKKVPYEKPYSEWTGAQRAAADTVFTLSVWSKMYVQHEIAKLKAIDEQLTLGEKADDLIKRSVINERTYEAVETSLKSSDISESEKELLESVKGDVTNEIAKIEEEMNEPRMAEYLEANKGIVERIRHREMVNFTNDFFDSIKQSPADVVKIPDNGISVDIVAPETEEAKEVIEDYFTLEDFERLEAELLREDISDDDSIDIYEKISEELKRTKSVEAIENYYEIIKDLPEKSFADAFGYLYSISVNPNTPTKILQLINDVAPKREVDVDDYIDDYYSEMQQRMDEPAPKSALEAAEEVIKQKQNHTPAPSPSQSISR